MSRWTILLRLLMGEDPVIRLKMVSGVKCVRRWGAIAIADDRYHERQFTMRGVSLTEAWRWVTLETGRWPESLVSVTMDFPDGARLVRHSDGTERRGSWRES